MARPRRKRAEIDAALVSAELSLRHWLKSCGDFPLVSRERTENLVEFIEALALAMVSPQKASSAEQQQILEMAERFVERQLEKLSQQGLAFASTWGVRAFFLSQLFERLRQEVSASKKEQFERRASGAYFTPIGLSYYLVQTAFSSAPSGCQNLRILDFCSGSGCLSIAALDYLSSFSFSSASFSLPETDRLSLLRKHVFAVEIDPLILRTYIACLAVACSSTVAELNRDGAANFLPADCFSADLLSCDLLLANPPWDGSSCWQYVERAGHLLAPGGVAAILTPAGIASDQGATECRRMLFEKYHWLSLEGFINEDQAFAIHPSYKYALSVFARPALVGQAKPCTRLRFGSQASDLLVGRRPWLNYSFALAGSLSPGSHAILECDSAEQFDLFKAIAENNIPLHQLHADGQMQMDRGRYKAAQKPLYSGVYSLRFARDLDLTIDKKLFISSTAARAAGFKADCYGRFLQGKWIDIGSASKRKSIALAEGELEQELQLEQELELESEPGLILSQDRSSYIEIDRVEDCLLPLLEGRMLSQFEIASKAYVTGSGRQALWHENAGENLFGLEQERTQQVFSTQYLVREADFYRRRTSLDSSRIGFVSVSAATNTRSMMAAILPPYPAGNSVPFLALSAADASEQAYWAMILVAVLNSFVFDFGLRTRFGGNNLNYFLLDQCSLPKALLATEGQNPSGLSLLLLNLIAQVSAVLSFTHLSQAAVISHYLARVSQSQLQSQLESRGLFAAELAYFRARARESGFVQIPVARRQQLRALLDALVAKLYGLDLSQFAQVLAGCVSGASNTSPVHSRGFQRVDKHLPFEQRLPNLAYQIFQDIETNRLDLNHLAACGLAAGYGSIGHGVTLLEESLSWLKLHQTRLEAFHQKSGVK